MTIKTINAPVYASYTLATKFSGVNITSYGSIAGGYGAPAAYYSGYGGDGGAALTLPKGGSVINNGGLQGALALTAAPPIRRRTPLTAAPVARAAMVCFWPPRARSPTARRPDLA